MVSSEVTGKLQEAISSVRGILIILILLVSLVLPMGVQASEQNYIVINIPSRTLDLYIKGKLKNTFPVGVGRSGFPTPIGNFKVIRKVLKPGWENPYKPIGEKRIKASNTNPLGTRWIGFKATPKGEYGIHGTDEPTSVGKLSSHGCVRMYVKDAEKLFQSIEKESPVYVTYDTVRITVNNNKVFMTLFPDVYSKGKTGIEKIRDIINKMNYKIIWNASVAFNALKQGSTKEIKIGTIINESDFY